MCQEPLVWQVLMQWNIEIGQTDPKQDILFICHVYASSHTKCAVFQRVKLFCRFCEISGSGLSPAVYVVALTSRTGIIFNFTAVMTLKQLLLLHYVISITFAHRSSKHTVWCMMIKMCNHFLPFVIEKLSCLC